MDGKDNKERKTREVADRNKIYQIGFFLNYDVISCCFGGWHESFLYFQHV